MSASAPRNVVSDESLRAILAWFRPGIGQDLFLMPLDDMDKLNKIYGLKNGKDSRTRADLVKLVKKMLEESQGTLATIRTSLPYDSDDEDSETKLTAEQEAADKVAARAALAGLVEFLTSKQCKKEETQELSLLQANIDDELLKLLEPLFVSEHSPIEQLDLSVNSITDVGAKLIANWLESGRSKTLTALSVSLNEVKSEGMLAFASAIKKNNSALRFLVLQMQREPEVTDDKVLAAFAEALEVNTKFLALTLDGNNIPGWVSDDDEDDDDDDEDEDEDDGDAAAKQGEANEAGDEDEDEDNSKLAAHSLEELEKGQKLCLTITELIARNRDALSPEDKERFCPPDDDGDDEEEDDDDDDDDDDDFQPSEEEEPAPAKKRQPTKASSDSTNSKRSRKN